MDFIKSSTECYPLIAAAADVCMKPWKHAVVNQASIAKESFQSEDYFELDLRLECRSKEGHRHPENDIELEIYRSGVDVNLMLTWCNQLERPILWQGQHSVWIDANSGNRCEGPMECSHIEGLARRIRALFMND